MWIEIYPKGAGKAAAAQLIVTRLQALPENCVGIGNDYNDIELLNFCGEAYMVKTFEKIDNFMEKGKSMGLVLKFFLLNIPFILEQMGPVCILLAGVVTLGILNHSNELVALKACGIPLKKITGPIIAAGIEPAWQSGWLLGESYDPSTHTINTTRYRHLLKKSLQLTSRKPFDIIASNMLRP